MSGTTTGGGDPHHAPTKSPDGGPDFPVGMVFIHSCIAVDKSGASWWIDIEHGTIKPAIIVTV